MGTKICKYTEEHQTSNCMACALYLNKSITKNNNVELESGDTVACYPAKRDNSRCFVNDFESSTCYRNSVVTNISLQISKTEV